MRADETEALDSLEAWVVRLQETAEFLAAIYASGSSRKRADVHHLTEFARGAGVAMSAMAYVRARPDTLQVSTPGNPKELQDVKRAMGPAAVLRDVLGRIEVAQHMLVKQDDAGPALLEGLAHLRAEIQRRAREADRGGIEAHNDKDKP